MKLACSSALNPPIGLFQLIGSMGAREDPEKFEFLFLFIEISEIVSSCRVDLLFVLLLSLL